MYSVRYGAGRAGFSHARPRPYKGPGRYVPGNPRAAPLQGPPALIPWMGLRLLPPIVTTLQIGSYSGLDSSPYGIPSGTHIEDRPGYIVYYQ